MVIKYVKLMLLKGTAEKKSSPFFCQRIVSRPIYTVHIYLIEISKAAYNL